MTIPRSSKRSFSVAIALVVTLVLLCAADKPPKKEEKKDEIVTLSPFQVSGGASGGYYAANSMGATPGGAKDARYFRAGAERGEIPHPDTITAEGLFSEHDLPLDLGKGGDGLFQVQSAATTARFEVLPAVRYLAQLGLSSGIKADGWKPAPLNLVAVVDKSGSMSGAPLALVRASLKSALRHMRDGDQLSIVLYGDRAHVHLVPTKISRATRSIIIAQIEAIESAGSTNMEAGLTVGYRVACESKAEFAGNTRVMLFTDERPNVGNTDAESFMAMAEKAAVDGIGLTTIGVGVQFGAELATRISSVHGANLFFFSSGDEMKKTFADEFDTLVTELAHDFSIRIRPAPGYRIEGVFGVPAGMLRWDGKAIAMDVATIFLSRRKGGIYFALAPAAANEDLPADNDARSGDVVAEIGFSYRTASEGPRIAGHATCSLAPPKNIQAGLSRGIALIDQYLTLKKAAQLHLFTNDQETAFRLVGGLMNRLSAIHDPDLASERKVVRDVHATLAKLAGHDSESQRGWNQHEHAPIDDLSGLPVRLDLSTAHSPDSFRLD